MRHATFLLVGSLLLAGCTNGDDVSGPSITAPSAMATKSQDISRDINLEIPHPCTGEPIPLTGRINTFVEAKFDAAGGLRIILHANPQGVSGTGADGTVYQAVGSETSRLMALAGGTELKTMNSVINIVSHGASPNFRLIEVHHVTVTPDGSVTAEFIQVNTSC